MSRVTVKDVRGMATRLERSMRAVGLLADGETLVVMQGSAAYGNSWGIEVRPADNGGRRVPFGTFHWGFTSSDAYERIHAMCTALEAVLYEGALKS